MNILLIDDQPAILSSLLSGIPWYELGFDSIFMASSADKARAILNSNHIDVVISDIEMPQETGLDLLAWARQKGFDFECILLTAHADFGYAQKAISLKISEYVIQPAKNEDIIRAVRQTVKNLEAKKAYKAQAQAQPADKINTAAQNIVTKTLFEEWPSIEQTIVDPNQLKARLNTLRQFGFQYEATSPCIIFLIHIRKWKALPLSATDFLAKYQGLYNQIFGSHNHANISFYLKDNLLFTIIFSPATDEIMAGLKALFEQIPQKTGAGIRLFHSATEMRFIRNAMDGIISYANQYTLNHMNEIQMIKIDSDDLYVSATGSRNYQHYIRLIRNYIQTNISEAIGRSDIADYLHLTPDNVSYIIKTAENMTVKEFINHIKMEYARGLLKNTQYAISEIAQKCGYDSFAYFSKVYRSIYGIAPSQERH